LTFSIGFFVGIFWIRYLQVLMPLGSISTFVGVFYYLRNTNMRTAFDKDPKDDILTYFWNVIVLKFWTFTFVIWMIIMDVNFIARGLL
jgi:hypothetical protein